MQQVEYAIGADEVIVVCKPEDTGEEVGPETIYGDIAEDATLRRASGWRIVTMHGLSLRHSGVALGREGSGFTTKVAITVVYARG